MVKKATSTGGKALGLAAVLVLLLALVGKKSSSSSSGTSTDPITGLAAQFVFSAQGLAATFTPTVTGGTSPYNYSWNFGDIAATVNTDTTQNPSHTFSADGTYTVTLTVVDASGATVIITAQVTVAADTSSGTIPSNTCPTGATITTDTIITQADIQTIQQSIACGEKIYSAGFLLWAQQALIDGVSVGDEQMAAAYGIPVSQVGHQIQINQTEGLVIGARYILQLGTPGQYSTLPYGPKMTIGMAWAMQDAGIDVWKADIDFATDVPILQKMGYLGGTKYVVGNLTVSQSGAIYTLTASDGKTWSIDSSTAPKMPTAKEYFTQYGMTAATVAAYEELAINYHLYNPILPGARAYQTVINNAIMAKNG